MKITINHDNCQHGGEFADRCLAATIRNPLGHERFCTAHLEEDDNPELTVVFIFDGQEHTLVLHDQHERDVVASEGWPAFMRSQV